MTMPVTMPVPAVMTVLLTRPLCSILRTIPVLRGIFNISILTR